MSFVDYFVSLLSKMTVRFGFDFAILGKCSYGFMS